MYLVFFVLFFLFILFAVSLRIANQYERAVVFRLGRYRRTAGPGLYLLLPFIEWQVKVDLRIQTTAVAQQEAITLDNVPIKINAVIWQRVVDPKRAVIEVSNVGNAVIQVAVTALRNVIGQHGLDDVLKAQGVIGKSLQTSIDEVTEPWSRHASIRSSRSSATDWLPKASQSASPSSPWRASS